MENLLSGFLGALIAIIVTPISGRYTNASRLNKIRKAIINYLSILARPKLQQYVDDSNKAIQYLNQTFVLNDDTDEGFDDMPMLTSEVLKSFNQNDLLIVTYSPATYTLLLDFYFAVEFLKKNMPLFIYNEFSEWTNKHLEQQNIEPGDAQFEHIRTCASIDRERQTSVGNIKMKIFTATELQKTLKSIVENLVGSDKRWIWKYFWKQ